MNLKLPLLIIIVALLNGIEPLYAQSTGKEITDRFFDLYKEDPTKAVDYAFATNKWMERNKDGVVKLKNQLSNTLELIGDYYGYEQITEKSAGENFKLVSYLLRYDRQPLRFTFVLYRPNGEWQLQNFQFDDNVDEELEEAGKVYRLKENFEW